MQRLLFICPDVPGGVRSYLKNLSEFLTQRQIGHAILSYGWDKGMTARRSEGDGAHPTRLTFSKYGTPRSSWLSLGECIKKEDLLICNDSFELEAISHLQVKNKIVFMLHGDLEHYHSILKRFHPVIDRVFCVSRGLKEKYEKLYPGLAFEVCHPLIRDFAGPFRAGSEPSLCGVFIGRFEYMKGADVFSEVVSAAVKNRLPIRWKAFVNKKGSESALVEKKPKELEMVYDMPNEKLLAAIGEADLLLFPSRSEGFGIVVLEAMKRGVVPIARNLPIGIPDMILDKETGYLADETKDILAIIEGLNKDRQKLLSMGKQAARFANEAFGYEKMGENYLAQVKKVGAQGVMEKSFTVSQERKIEKLLPEPVYRLVKWLHNKIKYGGSSTA